MGTAENCDTSKRVKMVDQEDSLGREDGKKKAVVVVEQAEAVLEGEEEEDDDVELKLIHEEHRIWKKNAPFLYDLCLIHNMNAGLLTTQWLPSKGVVQDDCSIHEIMVGLKKSDQVATNLKVMSAYLPNEAVEFQVTEFNERNELGGYASHLTKLNPIVNIVHDGDVNRARYMPSDPFIIATRMGTEIGIFNFNILECDPKTTDKCTPLIKGLGHTQEGFGLDWSVRTPGYLLSCGSDGTFLWNVEKQGKEHGMIPIQSFPGKVSDCAWNPHSNDVFATVSLDGIVAGHFWDMRENKQIFSIDSKAGELNVLAFNPEKENIFVTGGASKVVQLWDLRKVDQPAHELKGHTGEIYGLQWAPFNEEVLASCGEDRRVMIWDLNRIGQEQTAEEAEDGDPELLFIHGGHCSRVMDISWHPNEDWVMASVADNGEIGDLQIWQPAEHIYSEDVTDEVNDARAEELE